MAGFSRSRWALLAGTVVTVLVVTACGGGEEATLTPAPRPTQVPTAVPVATRTPTGAPQATPAPTVAAPAPTLVPTPTPTATPAAPKAKYGGQMTVSISTTSANEWDNYYTAGGQFAVIITQNLLNNITFIDPEDGSSIRPDLAERWAFSPDGKGITYNLTRGVLWHDGTPFSAKDVVASLNRARNPTDLAAGVHRARLAVIESVEQPDDFTVRVKLSQPSVSALTVLSVASMTVYPSHVASIAAWKTKPFGTGPFTYKNFQKDNIAEFLRNGKYFKKDEAGQSLPYLDSLTFIWITDYSLALSAFLTGRLSCACGYSGLQSQHKQRVIDTIKGAKLGSAWTVNILHLNTVRPPLDNIKVRQALSIGLDRQQLADVIQGGNLFYPPGYFYPRELGGKLSLPSEELVKIPGFRSPKQQDLELSKQLLREAGVDPSKLTLKITFPASGRDFLEAIASAWVQTGVKVVVDIAASSADLVAALRRGDFDITFNSGGNAFDDPADLVISSVKTGGPLNYSKTSNPRIDQLLVEQDAELDPSKRLQLLFELQRALLDHAAFVPAHTSAGATAAPPWMEGIILKRAFAVGAHHRFERVWYNQ